MIRTPITFSQPMTRTLAAEVVQTARQYESLVMITREQKVVNAKSVLGLLSLNADEQEGMLLVTEGPDEAEAAEKVLALLK